MSRPNYIETRFSRFADTVADHARRTGTMPFVTYADKCATAMAGIESLTGLLQWDLANKGMDDGPEVLSAYDMSNLLGLIQVTAYTLLEDAGSLDQWAQKHFVSEGRS